MANKLFGIADPYYDALRVQSNQAIWPDAGGSPSGLGGVLENKIYVWHADGSTIDTFDPTEAGLLAALAAAASGDLVWCPQIVIACTAGITIPASVTLQHALLAFSGFSGTGVTMSAGSALFNFSINFTGNGAIARGILASGVGCSIINGDAFVHDATSNTGIELSGQDQATRANTTDVYANAYNGTTALGLRIGDFAWCKTTYADAHGATNNIGVSFISTTAATETCATLIDGWGYAAGVGSIGMQIETNKYGRIIGGFAVGVAAGLLVGTGATALVYGLQWSSLVNNGTITYLPGDRSSTTSANGLGWFNVIDYGAVHDGLTDDTTAIQATINAAAAAGGGVVYFPTGVYIVGGALQDGARGNAQLLLPSVDTTGEQIGITLLGESMPGLVPSLTGSITTPQVTTLKGTLNSGAGGALLGGWGPVGSYQDFTLINLRIENLAFQMPANPVLSALNLSHVEAVDLTNIAAHTGGYEVSAIAQPTTSTSYGIITPNINNGAWTRLDSVMVVGFYTGIKVNEHTNAVNISIFACYYATEFVQAYHASIFQRLLIQWCRNGLRFTGGTHHLIVEELNVEHHAVSGAWFDSIYDVDDANNYGIGSIVYHIIVSGTGIDDPIVVNGASNLHVISIHSSGSTGTVTSIAAGTGIALTPDPIVATGTVALNAALNDLNDVDTSSTGTGDIIYNSGTGWEDYPLGITTKITANANKIRIGGIAGGNYFEVDTTTGSVRLIGDATAWDDIRIAADVVKPGATAPNWKAFGPSGNLQALMFEAGHHDEAMFQMQLPHQWKIGTNIYPHIHWTPVNTTAGNVVWELEYSWANIDGAFGAPGNMATDATAAGGTAWVHKLTDLKESGNNYISGAGKTMSSMLVCRIHRNSNSGSDTLNQDVALLEIDFHFEIDSFGSDTRDVKDESSAMFLESGDYLLLESGDNLLTE